MHSLDCYKYTDGTLWRYTSIGCYPMFYVTQRCDVLCYQCADEELKLGHDSFDPPINGDVNWEDPDLFCDACSGRIESAYAEDEDEEVNNDAA